MNINLNITIEGTAEEAIAVMPRLAQALAEAEASGATLNVPRPEVPHQAPTQAEQSPVAAPAPTPDPTPEAPAEKDEALEKAKNDPELLAALAHDTSTNPAAVRKMLDDCRVRLFGPDMLVKGSETYVANYKKLNAVMKKIAKSVSESFGLPGTDVPSELPMMCHGAYRRSLEELYVEDGEVKRPTAIDPNDLPF